MSGAVGERQRERLLALGAAVFAGTLIAAAREIEDSMLSDAVGAGGVPQGVGIAMAVAAVALFAKSFRGGEPDIANAAQAESTVGNDNRATEQHLTIAIHRHHIAAGDDRRATHLARP